MNKVQEPRRVLVSGASRGIGAAIARELAALGFSVALNFRQSAEKAEALRREIESAGGSAQLLPFDVSDRVAAAAALEADLRERGPFWGAVLNAGITEDGPFAGLSGQAWDRVLGTNLDSFYNLLRPLVMPMVGLRDGGRIVVISSVTGLLGRAGQTNYAAAKAGLIAAARSLALELAKRRITVNTVAPGFVRTDMLAGLDEQQLCAEVPLKRFADPEEVAALVGFLFGPRAGYITGQTLAIDGGLS
jgi:3-oxoacyl-[acyl-carrier protein] reductase